MKACVNFATMPRLPFVTLKNAAVLTLVLGGTAWLGSETVASKVPDFDDLAKRHAPVISPAMPGDLMLFGEPMPLETFGVREALDRELVVNTLRFLYAGVPFIAYIIGALLFLRFSFNEAEHAEVIAELERQGRR